VTIHNHTPDFGIVGTSVAMQRVRAMIVKLGPTNLPVLISGPTGAGKELVAAALHVASRRSGRFVPFNVCAIPESTYESALFGHVRGAFTGAIADHDGLLAAANGGTSFFDEIGGLPLMSQAKLLRALETREFYPVGARIARQSDFRIVSATNDVVGELVAAGKFRSDLNYRLCGAEIAIPPLDQRREDIPELVAQFIAESGASARIVLTTGAIQVLQERQWPGNVRQLRHAVELLIALVEAEEATISAGDVIAALMPTPATATTMVAHEFARRRLVEVLSQTGWDTLEASMLLGVNRVTVYRRMKRFGVMIPPGIAEQLRSRTGKREQTR
jgi:two-component system NtrC family response regulator